MTYLINIIAIIIFGWPATALGYVAACFYSGLNTGMFLYERHEGKAIDLFCKRGRHE